MSNYDDSRETLLVCEAVLAAFIPIVLLWSFTPTSVLQSNALGGILQSAGLIGLAVQLFAGVPAGIKGLLKSRHMTSHRKTMLVLSLLNLCAGAILLLMFALLLWLGTTGRASH